MIRIHEHFRTRGTKIVKGDELGLFYEGTLCIVLAFQKDRIRFELDLRKWSKKRLDVQVQAGTGLGDAIKPGLPVHGKDRSKSLVLARRQDSLEPLADRVDPRGKRKSFKEVANKTALSLVELPMADQGMVE
jgi:hypothetical protein